MRKKEKQTLFIEYCTNCKSHSWCSNHSQANYKSMFIQISQAISKHFPNLKIQGNKVPNNLIPIKTDQNKYFNASKNIYVYFPSIGSFQITFESHPIFSKKQTKTWPTSEQIINQITYWTNNQRSNCQINKNQNLIFNIKSQNKKFKNRKCDERPLLITNPKCFDKLNYVRDNGKAQFFYAEFQTIKPKKAIINNKQNVVKQQKGNYQFIMKLQNIEEINQLQRLKKQVYVGKKGSMCQWRKQLDSAQKKFEIIQQKVKKIKKKSRQYESSNQPESNAHQYNINKRNSDNQSLMKSRKEGQKIREQTYNYNGTLDLSRRSKKYGKIEDYIHSSQIEKQIELKKIYGASKQFSSILRNRKFYKKSLNKQRQYDLENNGLEFQQKNPQKSQASNQNIPQRSILKEITNAQQQQISLIDKKRSRQQSRVSNLKFSSLGTNSKMYKNKHYKSEIKKSQNRNFSRLIENKNKYRNSNNTFKQNQINNDKKTITTVNFNENTQIKQSQYKNTIIKPKTAEHYKVKYAQKPQKQQNSQEIFQNNLSNLEKSFHNSQFQKERIQKGKIINKINDSPIHNQKIWKEISQQERLSKRTNKSFSINKSNEFLKQKSAKSKFKNQSQLMKEVSCLSQELFCGQNNSQQHFYSRVNNKGLILEETSSKNIMIKSQYNKNKAKSLHKSDKNSNVRQFDLQLQKQSLSFQDKNQDEFRNKIKKSQSNIQHLFNKNMNSNYLNSQIQQSFQQIDNVGKQAKPYKQDFSKIKNTVSIGVQKQQNQKFVQTQLYANKFEQNYKVLDEKLNIQYNSSLKYNNQIIGNKNIENNLLQRALILKNIYGQRVQRQTQKYLEFYRKKKFISPQIQPSSNIKGIQHKKIQSIYQEIILFNKKSLKGSQITYNKINLLNFRKILKILSEKNEFLIIRLFENIHECKLGFYGVWLCQNYEWKCIIVNDQFYIDENGIPFYSILQDNQIWVLIIQKALALVLGGYEQLQKAPINRLFNLLTGSNFINFKIRQQITRNNKFLTFLSQVENKNFIIHTQKNYMNLEEQIQSEKSCLIYYVLAQRLINDKEILIKIKQNQKQPFWMKLEKFCTQFKSAEVLQLRLNHNFTNIAIPPTLKPQFVVLEMKFSENLFGCVTVTSDIQTNLRIYLYKQEDTNVFRMIGNAKQKCKKHLFFDCLFKQGKYFLFADVADFNCNISYFGQGFPSLEIKQSINQDGLKNDYTEYIPIEKIPIEQQIKMPKFISLNGDRITNSTFGNFQSQDKRSIDKLRQSFVDYLLYQRQ